MKDNQHIVQLVEQVRAGDQQAFRRLYDLHAKQMLNSCMRILADQSMAKDALQDAFVKAYLNIANLKDARTFSSWLKRIVINRSLELLRARTKRLEALPDQDVIEEVEDEQWYERVSHQQLEAAILDLPDRARIILSMYSFEGLTHQEIGSYLGLSSSTSKSQYRYGLRLLNKKLCKIREHEI